ncbi:MAG: radical SAM domain-containing protein, partial [Antricoccus sp.]
DHAEAILAMREQGREPMSMSHGDFDPDYLSALVLGPDGKPRLPRVSFAGHFDMLMFGRRGIERPPDEKSLHPYRRRFADQFAAMRREHGVRYFLAHNMTVTPRNLDQIAEVITECHDYGFGLFSFQPAAFIGDDRRWHEGYRDTSADDVWRQIETGAGARLPYRALQVGDVRCNRTTYGFYVGKKYFPILDDQSPADLHTRDLFFRYLGGVDFAGTPLPALIGKIVRVIGAHPSIAVTFVGWSRRMLGKVGIRRLLRYHRIRPVTFVMHSFMDATEVNPAWDAIKAGTTSSEPRILAAQERLLACSYAMAHPETGELVPACVQHSVLDPAENVALRTLLPMPALRTGA